MQRKCAVNLDTITTIPKAVLKNRLTSLSAEKVRAVDEAIRFALAMGA